MDLSALLGRGLGDRLAFAERIVSEAIDRLADDPAFAAGDGTAGERIAVALGNRLARLVLDEESWSARYTDLVDRNLTLAAALGACDCWGENVDCETCAGDGRPGWLPPEPGLFAKYVKPVASKAARAAATITTHPSTEGAPR
jgi:hypothetical protein